MKKQLIIFYLLLLASVVSNAQIEVTHVTLKNFKSVGFGGFLNFSLPVGEANYLTVEGGLQNFKDRNDNELMMVPVLLGYRYTLNGMGSGFYVEPNAGYSFGSSTIGKYNEVNSPISDGNGGWAYEKVAGPAAGLGFGYLFEPGGKVQFNIGMRYEHTFGDAAANVYAFRVSHAFSFSRRDN